MISSYQDKEGQLSPAALLLFLECATKESVAYLTIHRVRTTASCGAEMNIEQIEPDDEKPSKIPVDVTQEHMRLAEGDQALALWYAEEERRRALRRE